MILQTIITFKSNTDKFEVRKENDMFKDKNVVLGVCGGIAAYKIASLASALAKQGANVFVIMTKNATNFITSTTFETLTSNKCIVDTFDRNFNFEVEHIALAKKADVVLIAPATANVIGKISNGIADDMLTTTILACTCPVIISPAMNTRMYNNKIVKDYKSLLECFVLEQKKRGRTYTNALVKIGLVDEKRKITAVGESLLDGDTKQDDIEKLFNLSADNIIFLRQLLKLRVYESEGENYIYPFRMGIYLLSKFDDIPQKEFCTILSLTRAGKTDEEYRETLDKYKLVKSKNMSFGEYVSRYI